MRLTRWLRRPVVWLPISIGLLALLIARSHIWDAGSALATLDPRAVAAAAALCAPIVVLWAIRSADLLAAAGAAVPTLRLIPMTAFANTINNLTPGSAGEILRMYLLRAHHDVDYASSGAVVFVERVGAIGYLASSSLLAWLLWLRILDPLAAAVMAAILVAGPLVAYRAGLRPLSIAARVPGGRLLGAERWRRVGGWLGRVDATVAALVGSPRRLLAFIALSVAIFAVYTAQLVLLGAAVHLDLDPLAAWGALGLATTVGVLSLLPFGLGSTDLALAGLLGVAGVPAGLAASLVFGYRLVSTLPLSVLGIAAFAWLSAGLPEAALGDAPSVVGRAIAEPAVDTEPGA
jgi:uncharacterized protein (TIRG00374 family)